MGKQAPVEDALMTALVGKGSKSASIKLGRFGDITKRPVTWAGIAGVLALSGRRGRQAAARASASYVAGTLAHLVVKVAVGRPRPPGASRHTTIGPVTTSFPSGHCAAEGGVCGIQNVAAYPRIRRPRAHSAALLTYEIPVDGGVHALSWT